MQVLFLPAFSTCTHGSTIYGFRTGGQRHQDPTVPDPACAGEQRGELGPPGVQDLTAHTPPTQQRTQPSPYPFADRHCLLGHGLGVGDVVLHDGLEELVFIFSLKGGLGQSRHSFRGIPGSQSSHVLLCSMAMEPASGVPHSDTSPVTAVPGTAPPVSPPAPRRCSIHMPSTANPTSACTQNGL